jgi:hypothetical protein
VGVKLTEEIMDGLIEVVGEDRLRQFLKEVLQ